MGASCADGACRVQGQAGSAHEQSTIMDASLWMAPSGARWRHLPDRFGDYTMVKDRFYDRVARGVLGGKFRFLATNADLKRRVPNFRFGHQSITAT